MHRVQILIVEIVSREQPGYVVASMVDAFGATHFFHDKLPLFAGSDVGIDTPMPVSGWLGCIVIERAVENGLPLVHIDTSEPFDVQSIKGARRFVVPAEMVVDDSSE